MSTLAMIRRLLPACLRDSLRPFVQQMKVVWRTMLYAGRFAGVNVHIHPTAWVAKKALIRCSGGGKIVIGQHCEIHPYAMIDSMGGSVVLGKHCSLNPFAIIYGHGGTKLGNGVRIAAHSVIIPANHNFRTSDPLHSSGVTGIGISIGDDVWLGAGTRILDGVTIGDRSVVGAGAVVTRMVPPGSVATGVPARIKSIQAPE